MKSILEKWKISFHESIDINPFPHTTILQETTLKTILEKWKISFHESIDSDNSADDFEHILSIIEWITYD